MEKFIGDISNWTYYVVTGLIASVIWLIRKVVTNERQIELLKSEIALREQYKKERDDEIKSQLSELKNDIKSIVDKIK
jgi:hypothetical protein